MTVKHAGRSSACGSTLKSSAQRTSLTQQVLNSPSLPSGGTNRNRSPTMAESVALTLATLCGAKMKWYFIQCAGPFGAEPATMYIKPTNGHHTCSLIYDFTEMHSVWNLPPIAAEASSRRKYASTIAFASSHEPAVASRSCLHPQLSRSKIPAVRAINST